MNYIIELSAFKFQQSTPIKHLKFIRIIHTNHVVGYMYRKTNKKRRRSKHFQIKISLNILLHLVIYSYNLEARTHLEQFKKEKPFDRSRRAFYTPSFKYNVKNIHEAG